MLVQTIILHVYELILGADFDAIEKALYGNVS
jgi:hypothetical protein